MYATVGMDTHPVALVDYIKTFKHSPPPETSDTVLFKGILDWRPLL